MMLILLQCCLTTSEPYTFCKPIQLQIKLVSFKVPTLRRIGNIFKKPSPSCVLT